MMFYILILLLTLQSCLVSSSVNCENKSVIQWIDCAQKIPLRAALENGINITSATTPPPMLHCGEIMVPLNYEKPMSPENNITLGLAMYRPSNPKGVLYYNGGGGDPNVVVAWQVALGLLDTFAGLLDYDLMMLDTRGTYSSNPLNASKVSSEAVAQILQPFPTNESEFKTVKEASAAFIRDVLQNTSPPGFIAYASAREVAQDFEEVRKALSYEKINFIALSYGTYRATAYANMYPERVGNFVLDAIAPHGITAYYGAQTQIEALNRVLLRADAYCQNNSSCPFHNQGKGSIIAAYKQLLASAPLPVTGSNETVTAFDIQFTIAALFESEGIDFPQFFELLSISLTTLDGSLFAGSTSINISAFGTILIECGDGRAQDTTYADWKASYDNGLLYDTNNIAQPLAWQLQLGCLAWPFPTPPIQPLTTTVPMLLITSDFDGAVPTEWAEIGLVQAQDSVLVVRHGDDHTSFSLTKQPSTLISKEFLRTGVFPQPMSNTSLSVYTRGMQRASIPDPYDVPTGEVAGDVDSGNLSAADILP